MGFTTGFTGGVTLTLSLAYLATLAHQRGRERQAAVLRRQTLALTALHDPLLLQLSPADKQRLLLLPPTRAERAAEERRTLIDAAKDRWNAEVAHAARWAQARDWEEARERAEDTLAGLWARAFGGGGGDAREQVEDGAEGAAARAVKSEVRSAGGAVAEDVERMKAGGSDASSGAGAGGGGGIFSALGKSFERGKEAITSLGRAKSNAEIAEEKAAEELSGLSPEERTLKQRYQKPRADDRSVEEVLSERYVPTDRKNNTQLKAL